jgi:hypothetical protein
MPMDIKRLLTPPRPVRAVSPVRGTPPAAAPLRPPAPSLLAEAVSPLAARELPAGEG